MVRNFPGPITARGLIDRDATLLIDAYGVLVDGAGVLPGAPAFITALAKASSPFFVLTNDASRLPTRSSDRYKAAGMPIEPEAIITSGSLIAGWFENHGLSGAPTVVLGPEDSLTYTKAGGAEIVAANDDAAEVVVVCDDAGYPFLETVEDAMSMIFRKIDAGRPIKLLLPNPDLIYPKRSGEFGLTSGSVALMLEAALELRYPGRADLRFERLGKPHRPIFERAEALAGTRDLIMIGDQLRTDIQGANDFGIDSVLISGGIGQWSDDLQTDGPVPTWLMADLTLDAIDTPVRTTMSHHPNDKTGIQQRKVDHIELCAREEVEYRLKTTLLEQVYLMHQSLPEIDVADIDLSTTFVGKKLNAPLCISGMTGGAEAARTINRTLAAVAQKAGIAFGVGSQRAMLIDPSLRDTFAVRDVAPDIALLGNIGLVQAAESSTETLRKLVEDIDADALCIHMNPAQEMIQEGGDRDFRGGIETFRRLVGELGIPIIAKETGCGVSPRTADALRGAGVSLIDVSGAGGTTWVGVEALRARPNRRAIGEDFWEWGIPTSVSIAFARRAGMTPIASGGIRHGHDVARALAMGAHIASMALPFLRAVHEEGAEGAQAFLERTLEGLKTAMLLTGSATIADLQHAPRRLGPELGIWLSDTP